MSIIKNLGKSEKTKALEYFNLIDGCGDYTSAFTKEWAIASYEGMSAKDFDERIVKAYKDETKKK